MTGRERAQAAIKAAQMMQAKSWADTSETLQKANEVLIATGGEPMDLGFYAPLGKDLSDSV